MRRIAAVAVSAATLIGGLALATPAEAALTGSGSWSAPALKGVKAWGTYKRYNGHGSIYIYGHLQDTRTGWGGACVVWRVYNSAGQYVGYKQWRKTTSKGTSTLRVYHVYGGGVFHFKVRACAVKANKL